MLLRSRKRGKPGGAIKLQALSSFPRQELWFSSVVTSSLGLGATFILWKVCRPTN